MKYEPNELQNSAENLLEVLQHASQIRSWVYSEGETENENGGLFTEDLSNLRESLSKLGQCDWNVKKFFTLAAIENATIDGEVKLMNNWQGKVEEHLNKLELSS